MVLGEFATFLEKHLTKLFLNTDKRQTFISIMKQIKLNPTPDQRKILEGLNIFNKSQEKNIKFCFNELKDKRIEIPINIEEYLRDGRLLKFAEKQGCLKMFKELLNLYTKIIEYKV